MPFFKNSKLQTSERILAHHRAFSHGKNVLDRVRDIAGEEFFILFGSCLKTQLLVKRGLSHVGVYVGDAQPTLARLFKKRLAKGSQTRFCSRVNAGEFARAKGFYGVYVYEIACVFFEAFKTLLEAWRETTDVA